MALKPDRYTLEQEIAYFCNDVVNRGVILAFGSKCTLLKKGWVVMDQVASGITPVAGDPAYLAPFGQITNAAGTPQVGRFLSAKDEKGFVKLEVNLP
jgi:hypothetical protein